MINIRLKHVPMWWWGVVMVMVMRSCHGDDGGLSRWSDLYGDDEGGDVLVGDVYGALAALWAWTWLSATTAPMMWPTHVTWHTHTHIHTHTHLDTHTHIRYTHSTHTFDTHTHTHIRYTHTLDTHTHIHTHRNMLPDHPPSPYHVPEQSHPGQPVL